MGGNRIQPPMSTFKRGLYFSWTVSIALSAIVVLGVFFTEKDLTPIVQVAGFSWAETAIYDAVYAYKTKCENRAKYAQKFIKDLAETYGLDSVANVLSTILQD